MGKFQSKLKIYKWWNSHMVLMLVVIYYQLLMASPTPPPLQVLSTFVLFMIASIGIAGFGQILNDLYDVAQDTKSGTNNLVAHRSRKKIAMRFLLVILLGLVPWFWLPLTIPILVLLTLEFLLFMAYSIPPVRFKNRALLGPIADALYAYPVPMAVSLLVFGKLCRVHTSPWFVLLMMAWSFLYGFHEILTHQLRDASRDQLEEINTFVTRTGWRQTVHLMERKLLVVEAGVFTIFLLTIGYNAPLVPIGFLLYLLWMIYRWRKIGIWATGNPLRLPAVDKILFSNYIIMSRFNCEWLPVLLILLLAIHNPIYILGFLLHLYLFENGITKLIHFEVPEFRRYGRIF